MLEVRVGEVGANSAKLAKLAAVGLVGSDREDGRAGKRGRCGGSARARVRGASRGGSGGAGDADGSRGKPGKNGEKRGKYWDPVRLWAAGRGSLTPPPPWEPTAASPGFPAAHRAPLLSSPGRRGSPERSVLDSARRDPERLTAKISPCECQRLVVPEISHCLSQPALEIKRLPCLPRSPARNRTHS